jgi:hypothetical protein
MGMVGQIDRLFTGPQDIQNGRILAGVVGGKTGGIGVVFLARATQR